MKDKKISLNVSKEDFIKKMKFHSDEEKLDCEKYLDLKGISYHVILANKIGLNKDGLIEYKKVSFLYRYDKRIRNVLYKYLSAFEEGVRASVSNRFSNDIKGLRRVSRSIADKVQNGSVLSIELENTDFKRIISISEKLPIEMQIELFGEIKELELNLNALRELRNAVSHHRLLLVYDNYEECYINGVIGDSLKHNVLNLYQLLLPYYREHFKVALNNCCNDKEEPQFKNSIPRDLILTI